MNHNHRRVWGMVTAVGLSVALTGCPSQPNGAGPGPFQGSYPIKAVCTTGMVADLVKNVGGSHVDVTQLMGEGADPHLYKVSTGDISTLNRADVIFYSGLHLEGRMGDIFTSLARRRPTFAVAEGIPEEALLEPTPGHHDPHAWFDVSLWSRGAQFVADTLAAFDPTHADEYRKNADLYRADLAKLHDECKREIASIPRARRVLVTAHDAFEYFGRAYDIEVRAVQGISTEDEAALKKINELVDFLVDRKIKAVFVETSVNKRNIEALVQGCAARGHEVKVGGELFSDAMGNPNTPAGTYAGMVRHNVRTIVNALK